MKRKNISRSYDQLLFLVADAEIYEEFGYLHPSLGGDLGEIPETSRRICMTGFIALVGAETVCNIMPRSKNYRSTGSIGTVQIVHAESAESEKRKVWIDLAVPESQFNDLIQVIATRRLPCKFLVSFSDLESVHGSIWKSKSSLKLPVLHHNLSIDLGADGSIEKSGILLPSYYPITKADLERLERRFFWIIGIVLFLLLISIERIRR